jgi:hypothetical protein
VLKERWGKEGCAAEEAIVDRGVMMEGLRCVVGAGFGEAFGGELGLRA